MEQPKLSFKIDFDTFRIYINKVLHLMIWREGLVSIQGYRTRHNVYVIEFLRESGTSTIVEYEYRETWISVLNEVDKWH